MGSVRLVETWVLFTLQKDFHMHVPSSGIMAQLIWLSGVCLWSAVMYYFRLYGGRVRLLLLGDISPDACRCLASQIIEAVLFYVRYVQYLPTSIHYIYLTAIKTHIIIFV